MAVAVTTLGLSEMAALIGAGVGGGKAVYDAYTEWSKKNRETEHNQLFFYYRAARLLSEGKHEYVSDTRA